MFIVARNRSVVRGWWFVTPFAGQHPPQHGLAAFGARDPGAIDPWRVVPDVLSVAAIEVCDPMQFLILMKPDDAPVHGTYGFESQWNLCSTRCTIGVNTSAADTMNTSPAYSA